MRSSVCMMLLRLEQSHMPESRSDSDTGTAPVPQCSRNTLPEHVPGTLRENPSLVPTHTHPHYSRTGYFSISVKKISRWPLIFFWQHDSPGVPEKSGCVFADYYIIGNPSSFYHTIFFVCLFVRRKPEKSYSASCVGREVNPLGVIAHGQRHKPRAYQRQRHIPRTCQSMFYTLQMSLSMCYCSYFSILLSFTSLILP